MVVKVGLEGLFKPSQFEGWQLDTHKRIRVGVSAGMKEWGGKVREHLRTQMRSAFRIRRASFVNVMSFKLYAQRSDKLPGILVGAIRAPWLESQEVGQTLRGRGRGLLIPQFGRPGGKRFRLLVRRLMAQGNAHFANVRGRVILFAENLKESSRDLARFKRGLRKSLGGGRLKRSADIPIAVLVPYVKLRARLKIQATVQRNLPLLALLIENQMRLRR